jgi:uncharacterized protein
MVGCALPRVEQKGPVSADSVLITGASGLIGRALSQRLRADGMTVVPLLRRSAEAGKSPAVDAKGQSTSAGQAWWDLEQGVIDLNGAPPPRAVIHLAGENIGQGRWTSARKQRFVDSRVRGTTLLCEWMAQLPAPPEVLVSASATGFYGDRQDQELTEASSCGSGFLADLCRQWEHCTAAAEDAGIRVVHLRTGVVLSPDGGALQKMLTPFKLGLGGRVGSGRQWMSWLSLDDAVSAITFILDRSKLAGAVNLVGPQPVQQIDFARALGRALRRPTLAPVPAAVIQLLFGEMGRELLLASTRVLPQQLLESGFAFRDSNLDALLKSLLQPRP